MIKLTGHTTKERLYSPDLTLNLLLLCYRQNLELSESPKKYADEGTGKTVIEVTRCSSSSDESTAS